MPSFLFDSFRGGIDDLDDKGRQGGCQFVSGADIRKRRDTLSCQQALVDIDDGGVITDLIKYLIPASDGNMYAFGDTGKIYKITSAGAVSLVYTDANGEIKGASQWYIDNDKTYLFWATDTRLNSKEIPGATNWSDVNATITPASGTPQTYPKTNLESSNFHTMRNVNGSLLICNGQYVALVGYDGSYTTNSLNLLPEHIAKTIEEDSQDAIIGTVRADGQHRASVFFWDQLSTNWNGKRQVPFKEINMIMLDGEVPIMQADTSGRVFFISSSKQPPMLAFPGGGQVNPDGKDVDDGLYLMGVYGGTSGYNGIYSYGRKDLSHDRVLSLEYALEVDEIGSIKKFNDDVYISFKSGASYGLKKIDSTTKATAHYYSRVVKAPMRGLKNEVNWRTIIVECDALPASCTIEAYYRVDKEGNYIQAKLQDNTTAFDDTGGKKAIFLTGAIGSIHEAYLKLTPSGNNTPEIKRFSVGFD